MKLAACLLLALVLAEAVVLVAFRVLQRFNAHRFDP